MKVRIRSQVRRVSQVVKEVQRFIADYVVMPTSCQYVVASWVVASWLVEYWDRFPHLAITSPEKRCGKTRLLQILQHVTPNARHLASISPAAVHRLAEQEGPRLTFLVDEAQSLQRRGSQSADLLREILCAGIDKDAKVCRANSKGGVDEFGIYCPKAIALIGEMDAVLADRCLPVALMRKSPDDNVLPYRSRLAQVRGREIADKVRLFAALTRDQVAALFDDLDVLDTENDRMAELLLPLQAVMQVDCPRMSLILKQYARSLDKRDRERELESNGVRLLDACRDIFDGVDDTPRDGKFLPTKKLISRLCKRDEEPWYRFTRGGNITPEALANLLRPYGIRSGRNHDQSARGYFAHDFDDPWKRYLN